MQVQDQQSYPAAAYRPGTGGSAAGQRQNGLVARVHFRQERPALRRLPGDGRGGQSHLRFPLTRGGNDEEPGKVMPGDAQPAVNDKWINKFLQHLVTDRGASAYTQRNYRQAMLEFYRWHQAERQHSPAWERLQRDDFRAYLRFLGRHNLSRAAIQLRFSALRTFYRFVVRHGAVASSPRKNLALPKLGRRLPKFLTPQQMADLLAAPLKLLPARGEADSARAAVVFACRLDVAVLETIYSCGLRLRE